jgi:hypothetical protein
MRLVRPDPMDCDHQKAFDVALVGAVTGQEVSCMLRCPTCDHLVDVYVESEAGTWGFVSVDLVDLPPAPGEGIMAVMHDDGYKVLTRADVLPRPDRSRLGGDQWGARGSSDRRGTNKQRR